MIHNEFKNELGQQMTSVDNEKNLIKRVSMSNIFE